VATPSDLIQDTRTTPFNIGRRIELTDFTAAEAAPLAAGLGVPGEPTSGPERLNARTPERLRRRILYWTGGHPYLTQRLCQAVAAEAATRPSDPTPYTPHPTPSDVDRHCEELFLSAAAREKDDNLLFVRERLLRSGAELASLLDLYGKVRAGARVGADDTNPLIDVLRLSGVARLAGSRLVVRNRIYERVFDRAWVTTHMPDAELRRQQAAYRQGLVRATAGAAIILAVVGALALAAVQQAHRANEQRRVAEQERRVAQEGQRALRQSQYADRLNLARQVEEEGNLERAQELLEAVRPEPG
jgi:hypothetical protein